MATVKLGTTKTANKALSYAEKKAEVASGVECFPRVAQAQMKATRELYGKNDGIQAHTVIQSFEPGEVEPEEANEAGVTLAEKIAPGHECMVYTHTDKDHTHNHIIINAVHMDSGAKYQAHGQAAIQQVQHANDEICRDRGLSVPEQAADIRHTLAEQEILAKGEPSWKDEIREAIDMAKEEVQHFEAFREHLLAEYEVETKLRGSTLSYKHPDRQQFVRANKLGAAYQKEALERGFERQSGAEQKHAGTLERNEGTQRTDEELHSSADERGQREESVHRKPAGEDSKQLQQRPSKDDIDLGEARSHVSRKRRDLANYAERSRENDRKKQSPNTAKDGRTGAEHSKPVERNEQGDREKHQQHAAGTQQGRAKRAKRQQGLSR